MDDTMTAIEKLLALADEEEESEICDRAKENNVFEASSPVSVNAVTNTSNLIDLEKIPVENVDMDPKHQMETPLGPFCSTKVIASSTGSKQIETPKSRETRSAKKKSENLMYFSPAPMLVPKRILDLQKKGKFFSPSPPRPLPNAVPPRGIRQVAGEADNEDFITLTPVKHCAQTLKCATSDKKKRIPSANQLYADVNSPVKEYIYGRATPASLLKARSNILRSLPGPQQKPGQGFRASGISSITRIPKPKTSISASSQLSIGKTSLSASQTKHDQLENVKPPQLTGIPKPQTIRFLKVPAKVFEGSAKQRVRNENDDTLSGSAMTEAALRHTGLRNESGNASLLQGHLLTKQFYPGTPSTPGNRSVDRRANV